jgi:maternal protein exuperantia
VPLTQLSFVSNQVIKTKTEIAALLEFLDWLEAINTKDGIVFIYHDTQKFTPYMMIEAMKKYRLMERFQKIVKSFVNGYDLLDEEQANKLRYLELHKNYKLQLEKLGMDSNIPEEFDGDATVRAKLSYEILMLMAHGDAKKEVDEAAMAAIVNDFVRVKAFPMAGELAEIAEQEECIKRQSTLRDIFRGYFQASRYHR